MLAGDAMWSGLSPSGVATSAGGQPLNTVRMWVGACRGVAQLPARDTLAFLRGAGCRSFNLQPKDGALLLCRVRNPTSVLDAVSTWTRYNVGRMQ